MTGTTNYMTKFTGVNTGGNSQMQDDGTSTSLGAGFPSTLYLMNANRTQLTATGDGQAILYGRRDRDSQNDGTSYNLDNINSGVTGYSFWGDLYSFGVAGMNYNDYTRCGGTLGADRFGSYWGSLGYRSSGSLNYGVYGSSGYTSGTGYLPSQEVGGVGGGFYGDMVGSISRGAIIGQMNAGELFATYNLGDVYTSGRQIELVGTARTAAYSVTSPDVTVYKKGKVNMVNGSAYVAFDENFASLLGESPVVTATPMGACNGVYVSKIDKKGFTLTEQSNGHSTVEIAWIAVGDRVDANEAEIPAVLQSNDFDSNLKATMFNDGNKESAGEGMYWDGSTIRFGTMPASTRPVRKEGGR
jgi:hypothetical protein